MKEDPLDICRPTEFPLMFAWIISSYCGIIPWFILPCETFVSRLPGNNYFVVWEYERQSISYSTCWSSPMSVSVLLCLLRSPNKRFLVLGEPWCASCFVSFTFIHMNTLDYWHLFFLEKYPKFMLISYDLLFHLLCFEWMCRLTFCY